MTDLQLLQAAKTALLTALAANAGKPDVTIDGVTISWSTLWKQIADADAAIAAAQGPIELSSEG